MRKPLRLDLERSAVTVEAYGPRDVGVTFRRLAGVDLAHWRPPQSGFLLVLAQSSHLQALGEAKMLPCIVGFRMADADRPAEFSA